MVLPRLRKYGIVLLATVSAAVSFAVVSDIRTPAEAGSTHYYESANWPANPDLWMNSNMYYPLNTFAEDAVYSVDDQWDAVAGAWVNILVQGKKAIEHNAGFGDVPSDTIYITDFYSACTDSFDCLLGTGSTQTSWPNVWDVNKGLVKINEDNDIDWIAHNDSTQEWGQVDILSTLTHEVGHAMRMGHNNTDPCYSAVNTLADFSGAYTMCEHIVIWLGGGTVWPYQRTITPHERDDYAALY